MGRAPGATTNPVAPLFPRLSPLQRALLGWHVDRDPRFGREALAGPHPRGRVTAATHDRLITAGLLGAGRLIAQATWAGWAYIAAADRTAIAPDEILVAAWEAAGDLPPVRAGAREAIETAVRDGLKRRYGPGFVPAWRDAEPRRSLTGALADWQRTHAS